MPDNAILTNGRNSIWDAINNYSDLTGAFKLKKTFDDGVSLRELEIGFADLPAIEIDALGFTPKWLTYTKQKWPYALRITLFTADWKLSTAETLVTKISRAIYVSSATPGAAPYTAPYQPVVNQTVRFEKGTIGKTNPIKARLTTIDVGLRLNFQPDA